MIAPLFLFSLNMGCYLLLRFSREISHLTLQKKCFCKVAAPCFFFFFILNLYLNTNQQCSLNYHVVLFEVNKSQKKLPPAAGFKMVACEILIFLCYPNRNIIIAMRFFFFFLVTERIGCLVIVMCTNRKVLKEDRQGSTAGVGKGGKGTSKNLAFRSSCCRC